MINLRCPEEFIFPTNTEHPRGNAATGKPGSITNILDLLSIQMKLAKSRMLTAYSLTYL